MAAQCSFIASRQILDLLYQIGQIDVLQSLLSERHDLPFYPEVEIGIIQSLEIKHQIKLNELHYAVLSNPS